MVNTRTLRDYLASFQPTPNNEGTLVTVNLETVTSAAYLTPGTVAPVALSGDYNDLINLPTLGTAAAADASDFATAAQGNLADSAVQPAELGTAAYEDASGFATASQGQKADTAVQSIVAGTLINIDNTDPQNPIVSVTGGGTGIDIQGSAGIDVDNTDPTEPIISIIDAYFGDLAFKDKAAVADIDATGTPTSTTFLRGDGSWQAISGSGTVTSVGVSVPTGFSASGSPVTSSGTIGITYSAGYQGYTSAEAALVSSAVQPGDLGDLSLLDTINNAQWSGADLAVANGGTGASDASGARTNLGLIIGTDVQAYSSVLASWAGVTRATGFDTFAATPSSANLRALLTDEVGTGSAYFVGGALGTPASATLTNGTGLPIIAGTTGTLTVARGGTGATDASSARTNLGLVIGTNVQAYDANTAKINAAQTWTASQQFARVTRSITAVAALNLDCSTGNEFTKTIAGNSTFTVSNVPATISYDLRLLMTYTSGTITWFSGVQWVGGTAPTFTGGKVYEIIFTTFNSGTTWRAVAGEYAA